MLVLVLVDDFVGAFRSVCVYESFLRCFEVFVLLPMGCVCCGALCMTILARFCCFLGNGFFFRARCLRRGVGWLYVFFLSYRVQCSLDSMEQGPAGV